MQIKRIVISAQNHRGDKSPLVPEHHRSGEDIAVLPPPFPVFLVVNLLAIGDDVRHGGEGDRLCPPDPVGNIVFNAPLVQDHVPEVSPGHSVPQPAEKGAYLVGQLSAGLLKLLPSQTAHRLHASDQLDILSQLLYHGAAVSPRRGFVIFGARLPPGSLLHRSLGHGYPVPLGGLCALLGPSGGLTVRRHVEPLLYGQLAPAEDAAYHSAPKELLGGGGGIHHGVLVLQAEQGILPPINGVLRQPGDRPLDDLLPALVQHGVHPLPEYALVVRRQGVDTAAGLHHGVEQPG